MLLPVHVQSGRSQFPLVTVSLLAANVLVYVLLVAWSGMNGADPLSAAMSIPDRTLESLALWPEHFTLLSLVTAPWMHFGIIHLVGNCIFLWVFGKAAESSMGGKATLGIFVLGGLFSILVQLTMAEAGIAPSAAKYAGSSGAIIAVIVAFGIRRHRDRVRIWLLAVDLDAPAWAALAAFVAWYAILPGLTGSGGGAVGYWGHVGGICAGLIGALCLRLGRHGEIEYSVEDSLQAIAEGNLREGLSRLEIIRRKHPDDTRVLLAMARAHVTTWNPEQARSLYAAAVTNELHHRRPSNALTIRDEAVSAGISVPAAVDLSVAGAASNGGDVASASAIYRQLSTCADREIAALAARRLAALDQQTHSR